LIRNCEAEHEFCEDGNCEADANFEVEHEFSNSQPNRFDVAFIFHVCCDVTHNYFCDWNILSLS